MAGSSGPVQSSELLGYLQHMEATNADRHTQLYQQLSGFQGTLSAQNAAVEAVTKRVGVLEERVAAAAAQPAPASVAAPHAVCDIMDDRVYWQCGTY